MLHLMSSIFFRLGIIFIVFGLSASRFLELLHVCLEDAKVDIDTFTPRQALATQTTLSGWGDCSADRLFGSLRLHEQVISPLDAVPPPRDLLGPPSSE